jgi:import receptor subunit TOM7
MAYLTLSEESKVRSINLPMSAVHTADSMIQERIARVIDFSRVRAVHVVRTGATSDTHRQVAIHYGYLPLIIYLGYTQSNPRPTLIRSVTGVPNASPKHLTRKTDHS